MDKLGVVRKVMARELGLKPPGRAIKVRADDCFLVSYPRSGNTWLRFLLTNLLLEGEKVDFVAIERAVPDIYLVREREIEGSRGPRILKSHEYYDPRYKKVIYIHRDPRDVAISYYYYRLKVGRIQDGHPMDQFVSSFIEGEIHSWGRWCDHVSGWMNAKGTDLSLLPLSYDDLLTNTAEELGRVCRFINLDVTSDAIRLAVAKSSTESMKKAEGDQARGKSGSHSPRWADGRKDINFVRSASSGDGRRDLPARSVARIEKAWGPLMRELGYL